MRWPGLAIMLCWSAFILVWVLKARANKRTSEREAPRDRAIYVLCGLPGAYLIFAGLGRLGLPSLLSHGLWSPSLLLAWLGVAVTVGGFALAVWARISLGRNWSADAALKEDHELVTGGPYKLVRHPIYAGILLMLVGTAAVADTRAAALGLLLCLVAIRIKSAREEMLMTRAFPAEYPSYQRSTKRLIPYLW